MGKKKGRETDQTMQRKHSALRNPLAHNRNPNSRSSNCSSDRSGASAMTRDRRSVVEKKNHRCPRAERACCDPGARVHCRLWLSTLVQLFRLLSSLAKSLHRCRICWESMKEVIRDRASLPSRRFATISRWRNHMPCMCSEPTRRRSLAQAATLSCTQLLVLISLRYEAVE